MSKFNKIDLVLQRTKSGVLGNYSWTQRNIVSRLLTRLFMVLRCTEIKIIGYDTS